MLGITAAKLPGTPLVPVVRAVIRAALVAEGKTSGLGLATITL